MRLFSERLHLKELVGNSSNTAKQLKTSSPSFPGPDRRGDVRVLFRPLKGERGRARTRPALQGHPTNEEGVLCARTGLRKESKTSLSSLPMPSPTKVITLNMALPRCNAHKNIWP